MSEAKWKLVPVEPNADMEIAGFESEAWDALGSAVLAKKGWPYSCRESAECVKAIYRAMLSVAPQPVQTAEDERAAFEVWRSHHVNSVTGHPPGAWDAWQARAALASKPVPAGEALKFTGVDDTQQMHRVRMLLESHGLHMGSKFIASLVEAAQPVREPMSEEQIENMARDEQFLLVCDGLEELTEIIRCIERHHGITKE